MMDRFLLVVVCVLLAAAGILLAFLVAAGVYMAVNHDKYECHKTGWQVLTMLPAGKVMVPIMQDETVCHRIDK